MTGFLVEKLGIDFATLIASAIPFIELKGGILLARGGGLSFFTALLLSFIGSTAIFFIIYFLLKPIFKLLKKIPFLRRLAIAIDRYFTEKASAKITANNGGLEQKDGGTVWLITTTVLIFVAIPLPMTGVYTGTAIAVYLGLDFKHSLLAVAVGNFIAGFIISILAEILLPYVNIILYALLVIAFILLVVFILKIIKKVKEVDLKD